MRVRQVLALATAVVAFAAPVAAHADEGLGVATQVAGYIYSASEALVGGGPSDIGGQRVDGSCTFYGQTNVSGGWDYQYGGQASASSTSPTSQPELVDIKCTLTSPQQPTIPGSPATLTASCEIALAGPQSECAASVSAWPARPVSVCVDGYAIFGPTPVVTKTIVHACRTSTL